MRAPERRKPDTAVSIAKRWTDIEGVEMITGTGSSAVGLALRTVLTARGKIESSPPVDRACKSVGNRNLEYKIA